MNLNFTIYDLCDRIHSILAGPIKFTTNCIDEVIDENLTRFVWYFMKGHKGLITLLKSNNHILTMSRRFELAFQFSGFVAMWIYFVLGTWKLVLDGN